jgi:hypothetical protein
MGGMNTYGAKEVGGLSDGAAYHAQFAGARHVPWTTPGLRIVRLRMVSDPGFPWWDITYCHGMLGDEPVIVTLPFDQLPRRGWKKAIVKHAQRAGVFALRLGIIDPGVVSTLV